MGSGTLTELRRRIRVAEGEVAAGEGCTLEQGLDLLDVMGRSTARRRLVLEELRAELVMRELGGEGQAGL